jgi:hypothetical protein
MHWKKRMMSPPPQQDAKVMEVISKGGAGSETLKHGVNDTDIQKKPQTLRAWDDLSVNEKCNRLGRWIGHIMDELEKEER